MQPFYDTVRLILDSGGGAVLLFCIFKDLLPHKHWLYHVSSNHAISS